MSRTDDLTRRLVWNLKKWTRILDEAEHSLSGGPQQIMEMAEQYDFSNLNLDGTVRSAVFGGPADAHLISICLRQIDEHARELQKSPLWAADIATTGTRFCDLMDSEDLRDLRDVVEHAADYIAGRGRKPDLVLDPDQDWPSAMIVNDRVASISVFGRAYEIQPAIFAAIAFVKTLPKTDAEQGASLHQG